MEEQDSDEGIEFLGSYGTIEVLEYMKDHPQCKEEDLANLVEDITVAELIEKLQKTGLVDEDIALTEKGKTLLVYLGCLREMLMGQPNSSESFIDWSPLPKKVNRERHNPQGDYMVIKRRLAAYYAIYEQVYENPGIPLYEIAQHTRIPRSSVSRYLAEMYALSVLKGPMICVKPAHNYWNYAHFLTFENPLTVYRRIKGFPYIISRNLTAFYPHGVDQYFLVDFLFHTHYHTQLANILGMLPATSVFFSVGNHLFARVSFLDKPVQSLSWIEKIPSRSVPCYDLWRLEYYDSNRQITGFFQINRLSIARQQGNKRVLVHSSRRMYILE